ncbi:HIRAN domain-containing protein [Arthrobacter sp. S39]|uniref:HIRAN domain-containing protein n=1 Tax=Arthrobacter sp. S39 TaxID=2509720 RepID=UPI0010D96BD9|nr:HIRAN domain-containing protein [Arthrobacter sp. S39]TAP39449.1 hypothetical protein EYS21_22270 [Arthrobacter sp. S39]
MAWQNPDTRTYVLLGRAYAYPNGGYEFKYLPEVSNNANFRPIPGFSDVTKVYTSKVLFPFFAGRVMSSKRPDRKEWLDKLNLPENAAPFEILRRSFGKRVADTYEMFAEPDIDRVTGSLTFLVPTHGLRYMTDEARAYVDRDLDVGEPVGVVAEPANAADPRAQGIWTAGGHKIGFVPAPVLDYVALQGVYGKFQAHVAHINRRSDGLHLRVLIRLTWAPAEIQPG